MHDTYESMKCTQLAFHTHLGQNERNKSNAIPFGVHDRLFFHAERTTSARETSRWRGNPKSRRGLASGSTGTSALVKLRRIKLGKIMACRGYHVMNAHALHGWDHTGEAGGPVDQQPVQDRQLCFCSVGGACRECRSGGHTLPHGRQAWPISFHFSD